MPQRDSAPIGAPCWIDLFTTDPDKSRAFYGELFGWESESAGPEYGGYINFTKDGVPVAGAMQNDGANGTPDLWSIYLASEDAQATADAAVKHGGQVMVAPMAVGELGTMAVVIDAGGAAIGIWQPGLHKGFGVVDEPNTPGWFELHTRDYDATVQFYKDVFGWDARSMSDTPEFRYTTLNEGEDQLAGVMDASGFLPGGSSGALVRVLPCRQHRRGVEAGGRPRRDDHRPGRGHAVRPVGDRRRPDRRGVQARRHQLSRHQRMTRGARRVTRARSSHPSAANGSGTPIGFG